MSIEASGKSSDAMSTKSASSPTSSAQPGETLAIPAASIDPERHARNEALLNRILAQQNAAMANVTAGAQHFTSGFDEGAGNKYDASGLLDPGAACKRVRAPPRRVVTWVNEIRYNLTVAVGSWAYMAPEVVLGHPYNEKQHAELLRMPSTSDYVTGDSEDVAEVACAAKRTRVGRPLGIPK
eukprot:351442-Chlamydomonas_euryale.AAC.2